MSCEDKEVTKSRAKSVAKPLINEASVLRYPFREMNMGWWEDYIRTVQAPDRVPVVLHVMDCLMSHAILHEDPFLEEVVMQMNKALPKTWPRHVSPELINNFEIVHHIFKTICVAAKFPTLEAQAKRGLLSMTEQRLRDIGKAFAQPLTKDVMSSTQVVRAACDRLRVLYAALDSRAAFAEFMDALKTLFYSITSKDRITTQYGTTAHGFDTFVCCDGCPCYTRLRNTCTLFLRDVEKAKIIDCFMIMAIRTGDSFMHDIASELLSNHFKDFMENPYLDDIGRHIQNGKLFYCRTALFDTLNLVHYLTQLHSDLTQALKDGSSSLDRVVLSLLWVKNEVKDIRTLNELCPLLDHALATSETIYARLGRNECLQDLHTLKEYTLDTMSILCGPEYHLAVHSRDVFVGKPADMKCANLSCPGETKDLLKCSGCDVTYYCSSECQKADWEKHKNFCHEIESRRAKPAPILSHAGEWKCIKPVA